MNIKAITVLLLTISFIYPMRGQIEETPFDSLDVARIQVMYDLTYREDSTHLERVGRERMILLLGGDISQFESYRRYRMDRIRYEKMNDGTYVEWFANQSHQYNHRFHFQVFKNYPAGKITYTDRLLLTGTFKYEENLDILDWEIHDDTLTIEGYLCQKAVCHYGGRAWEAWFTDELPFSDGPYKFHGLPGLILKAADMKNHYSFDFISIEVPNEGTNIEWYNIGYYGSEYITTDRKAFFRAEDNMRESIMNNFDERTSVEAQKRAYGVMKSRNNPIELNRK